MVKKTALWISMAFLMITVISCASHEAKLKESGLTPMTQEELESLFSKPLEFSFTTADVSGTGKYINGKAESTTRHGVNKGTYEIKNGLFCSKWDFRQYKERCGRYYKISDKEYHVVDPATGRFGAKIKLK